MFFAKQINNNIYVAFTDTSAQSRELLKSIRDKLPNLDKATIKSIENFLKQNEIIDNNARRQQDYISHLKTYIDIVHSDKCMVLHIYVIPKDFDITLSSDDDTNISRLQKLSFDIFKAHKQLTKPSEHDINITKQTSAESFIEMELEFYLSRLNTLYDFLLNYKRTIRDKIIVSDKKVGHEIDNLNILEPNPLKIDLLILFWFALVLLNTSKENTNIIPIIITDMISSMIVKAHNRLSFMGQACIFGFCFFYLTKIFFVYQ